MREILGYAPIEPDGSVNIQVPAYVAFHMSLLDANARRITPDAGRMAAGDTRARRSRCNGCHTPAGSRRSSRVLAWALGPVRFRVGGAGAAGVAFPEYHRLGHRRLHAAAAGETMAEARMAESCAQPVTASAVLRADAAERQRDVHRRVDRRRRWHAGHADHLRYDDRQHLHRAGLPHQRHCARLLVLELPHRDQLPRAHPAALGCGAPPTPVASTASNTCTQGGCHNPVNAAGTAQTPAGNLDLTSTASNVPPQLTSYQQLLFPHNVVMMGANGPGARTDVRDRI